MVVARPVEPSSATFEQFNSTAPIVPTKILTDPEELDRQILQNGYATAFYNYMEKPLENEQLQQQIVENGFELAVNDISSFEENGVDHEEIVPSNLNGCELEQEKDITPIDNECISPDSETEKYTVTLHKWDHGLGKYSC